MRPLFLAGNWKMNPATLEEAGVSFTIRQQMRGREASEEVLDVVQEVSAELCVIGIRRRTAVGKMLMGSNAHRIVFTGKNGKLTYAGEWVKRKVDALNTFRNHLRELGVSPPMITFNMENLVQRKYKAGAFPKNAGPKKKV